LNQFTKERSPSNLIFGQHNICDASFFEKWKLKGHIESVHIGKKPFKCNVCDVAFSRKLNLKGHIESVHKGKKPFKCNICDAAISRKQNLKGHIESVHGEMNPLKCNAYVHEREEPFKCI
jgi:uncharacterized Zn-finger protein